MNRNFFSFRSHQLQRAAVRMMQAATLALAVSMALPSHAADERAVKSRVAPVYPELAKRMRITGEVRLEVTVSPEGKVLSVKALSGNSMLSNAAQNAVRRWQFEPGPAVSVVEVSLNFDLSE